MEPNKVEALTHRFAKFAGTTAGLVAATISVAAWLIAGHFFEYSHSWENALTVYIGCITFLLFFIMQRAQDKELAALHVKLNEIIAALDPADNKLINVEDLTEKEIKEIHETHKEKWDERGNA